MQWHRSHCSQHLPPPCKHSYNQIVSRSNTVLSHILALPLGILCAQCVTPFFVRNFLNINNFITIKTYEDF